jgi:DNA-binding LacI/PurR family transcriptional regulator
MFAKRIGLVIPAETHLFSPWAYNYYFTEILRGAIASATLFEWNILIHRRGMDAAQDYIEFCEKENIDGVVYLAPALSEKVLEKIKSLEVPMIVVNGRYPGVSYVDTDNKRGMRLAVEYLLEMGHKDIGIINGDMSIANANDRFEGYKQSLASAGIELNHELVAFGNFTEDSGTIEMNKLLAQEKRPTAVLCSNDLMAIGAMRAIKEAKLKIPQDISVVGFDDIVISHYLTPPLTSVRQPFFHLGKEAVVTLMSIIRGEKDSCQEIEIETRLIKRKSVAPPRARS